MAHLWYFDIVFCYCVVIFSRSGLKSRIYLKNFFSSEFELVSSQVRARQDSVAHKYFCEEKVINLISSFTMIWLQQERPTNEFFWNISALVPFHHEYIYNDNPQLSLRNLDTSFYLHVILVLTEIFGFLFIGFQPTSVDNYF